MYGASVVSRRAQQQHRKDLYLHRKIDSKPNTTMSPRNHGETRSRTRLLQLPARTTHTPILFGRLGLRVQASIINKANTEGNDVTMSALTDKPANLIQSRGVMPVNWKLLQLFTARTDNGHAVAKNNTAHLGFLIIAVRSCRRPFRSRCKKYLTIYSGILTSLTPATTTL